MISNRKLPPDFLEHLKNLEKSYLSEQNPIRQSGFAGGPERWRREREPILEAIDNDGEILDIGCANGYLLECLLRWGAECGLRLSPWGLDSGAGLIQLCLHRFPKYKPHFFIGNAWDWIPPQKFRYAYTMYDCVPMEFLEEYIHRLLLRVIKTKGRLIIGAYGSRSRQSPPFDLNSFLALKNFKISGSAGGGTPPITTFVWLDKEAQ